MPGLSCGEIVNSCVKTAESSEMSPDQLDVFMVDCTLIRSVSPCRMNDLMLSVHSTELITHNPSAPCNSITMTPAWTEGFIQRSGGVILGAVVETNIGRTRQALRTVMMLALFILQKGQNLF